VIAVVQNDGFEVIGGQLHCGFLRHSFLLWVR
jgi:hypothetical protein